MRALLRALVLVAVVLDVPVLARVVGALTREPRVEELEVDGVRVEVLRPPDERPRPAWLFVNGAHPERRNEPVVLRLSRGLARAGFVVFVPDVPGLGTGTITPRTLAATDAVVKWAAAREDVRGGRVALIGASTGAGLALLAAGRPELAGRVSVVAAVAPYADLRKLICLTTTSAYAEKDGFARYEVTDLQRQVVARSLVAALSPGPEREQLLEELDRVEARGTNPLEELPRADAGGADAQCVLALLANREPERFGELYDALPPSILSFLDELSPLRVAASLRAPIEVVVPPSDVYFPLGEAEALAAALPNVRLTVTRTLDHTRPSLSLARLRDFAAFLGFVVRGLRAAA
jgi:pimeloyl-ACP methyl ester carboxylesterase